MRSPHIYMCKCKRQRKIFLCTTISVGLVGDKISYYIINAFLYLVAISLSIIIFRQKLVIAMNRGWTWFTALEWRMFCTVHVQSSHGRQLPTLRFDFSGNVTRLFFPFFPASTSRTLTSSSLTDWERAFSLRLNSRLNPLLPESFVFSSVSTGGEGGTKGGEG